MSNKIESIQVLGSGCSTCKKLFELTKQAVSELNLGLEVEYITDIQKIIEMGVMTSPVLAIDGKPVLTGGSKSEEEIKEAICGTTNTAGNENGCEGCSCGGNC